MRLILLMLALLPVRVCLQAQLLTGQLKGPSGEPVQGATVTLRIKDSAAIRHYALSNASGEFRLPRLKGMVIQVRHLSYAEKILKEDDIPENGPWVITLEPGKQMLKEVVVTMAPPIVLRNDTVVYNASAYTAPDVRRAEELLGKMQGFSISPDGRISYNGRPVEKVMVDGEDLAGKGYQLLTKNLNASYIDKVEVITNFSSNRLMREVRDQDAVGVNLRIKSAFRERMSINAEAAASWARYNAGANALYLGTVNKLFAFVSSNNTADDVMGSLGKIYEDDIFPEPLASPVIETGRLPEPPLSDRYKKDNNDVGGAVMTAWKAGSHNRLRALAGYALQGVHYRGAMDVVTSIPGSDAWRVESLLVQQQKEGHAFGKVIGQRDDSAGRVDDYYVDISLLNRNSRFSNITSISVEDSLSEVLDDERASVTAGWKATRKLVGKRLFQLNMVASVLHSAADLRSSTSRYSAYFNLDSSYDRAFQHYQFNRVRLAGEGLWLGGVKHRGWKTGVHLQYERTGMKGGSEIAGKQSTWSAYGYGTTEVAGVHASITRDLRLHKKTDIIVYGAAGPGYIKGVEERDVFLRYDLSLGFVTRFSLLKVLRVKLSGSNVAPDMLREVPSMALSGNATILEGMDIRGPEAKASAQVSYHLNNIRSQLNWTVNMNVSHGASVYSTSTITTPAYSAFSYKVFRDAFSFFLASGLEKFIPALKGKTGISVLYTDMRSPVELNGEKEKTRYASAQGEVWWISGFSRGPGFESRVRAGHYASSLQGLEGAAVIRGSFSQKVTWKMRTVFSSLIWNAVQLGSKGWFQGLDLFIQKKLAKGSMLWVKGINLLNAGATTERAVQPYSSSSNIFRLVPRYVLAGASLQLK